MNNDLHSIDPMVRLMLRILAYIELPKVKYAISNILCEDN